MTVQGKYSPAASRWVLLLGGTAAAFWLAACAAHLALGMLEVRTIMRGQRGLAWACMGCAAW